MSFAIIRGFGACFSQPTSAHCFKFFEFPPTTYKIVRALDPVFDAVEVGATSWDASEDTLNSLAFGRRSTKLGCQCLGLFYVFSHVVPSVVRSTLSYIKSGSFQTDQKKTKQEKSLKKILYSGALVGRTVKEGSALCAFVTTPFIALSTHRKIMLCKHVGGFFGLCCELSYYLSLNSKKLETEEALVISRKIFEIALGIIEKVLQVVYDCLKLSFNQVSPKIRLPLTFAIAGFGLYRIWVKTA